jgi:RNA polymerase primary sigma factor
MGFLTGIDKFDIKRKNYFSYFVGLYVRAVILETIDTYNRTIRIPLNRLKEIRKINTVLIKYEDENIINNIDKISDLTDIPQNKILNYLTTDEYTINIDYINSNHGTIDVYKNLVTKDLQHDIHKILNDLSTNERYIIIHYYGLFEEVKMSKKAISEYLGISVERVRQIKNKVIRRFRHSSYSSILIRYLD